MISKGAILKTNIGLEFEILDVGLTGRYKAKCNNLALFICVNENIITDVSGKFLGVVSKINYIFDGEYIDHEQVSTQCDCREIN